MEEGYGKYVLRQKSIMINSMLYFQRQNSHFGQHLTQLKILSQLMHRNRFGNWIEKNMFNNALLQLWTSQSPAFIIAFLEKEAAFWHPSNRYWQARKHIRKTCREFSHDVTSAILVSQNNETTASRPLLRGTQRRNVSKYARSVSNSFLRALEDCLVNLELP